MGERHVSMYPSEHVEKLEGEERMKALLAESAAEEEGKLREFVMRLEFNKKLVSCLSLTERAEAEQIIPHWAGWIL